MFQQIIHAVQFVSYHIITTIVTIFLIYSSCLLLGFVRRRFGSRVQPDARKAIIITGATSGLGLIMANYFYKLGFTVIAAYYNKLETGYVKLDELRKQQEFGSKKNKLFLVPLDVTSEDSIKAARKQIEMILDEEDFKLFCLINNAGIASDGPFEWSDTDMVKRVVGTNLIGVMMVTRQFMFRVIKDKGRIVNVSSGLHAAPCMSTSVYGATKSGVAHFSDAINYDIKPYGASCRCIIPGNLISSTNISFTRMNGLNKSIAELTDEEKQYYGKSIRVYTKIYRSFAAKAQKISNLTAKELNDVYGVDVDQLRSTSRRMRSKLSYVMQYLEAAGYYVSGAVSRRADTSYILNSFDDAVRLVNCPNRLYTGNFLFTNIAGPLLDLIPYELIHQVSNIVFSFV